MLLEHCLPLVFFSALVLCTLTTFWLFCWKKGHLKRKQKAQNTCGIMKNQQLQEEENNMGQTRVIKKDNNSCSCLHSDRSFSSARLLDDGCSIKQSNVKGILIAYATQTNTACKLAHKLFSTINVTLHDTKNNSNTFYSGEGGISCCQVRNETGGVPKVNVLQLAEGGNQCSVEHLLETNLYGLVVFIVSTFTDGTAPQTSQTFAAMLQDAYTDFRVPRDVLSRKKFAIFGLGDVAYGAERFNRFAKDMYTWCKGLGATFVLPPVYSSEANTVSLFNIFTAGLVKWIGRAVFTADGVIIPKKRNKPQLKKGVLRELGKDEEVSGGNSCDKRENNNQHSTDGESDDDSGEDNNNNNNESGDDVEDLVTDDDGYSGNNNNNETMSLTNDPPELLYPQLRSNLQRQGYHLVGTHSGVKLCRWTKAMLRGRGGCYKHTFYNISSHQCMEMTPSLACANKCVFCWRHHTNPVSRSFRWKVDPPQQLLEGGLEGHYKMMKQMRGVPGVTPERMEEAMQVRHCALSLVGEPIMYPEINTFVDMLHERNISSFMVTNAQFPEQLRNLKPVTQLYLSIDAPTAEELKRVDRPLFEDYWERCLACVRELRRKPQRTVFRLTLINQYNTENIAAYADLVRLGWPDFIEVKGVTYCGTSKTSTLTMKDNVPRHAEVVSFCEALCEALASDTEPREKRTWKPTETEVKTKFVYNNDNNNNSKADKSGDAAYDDNDNGDGNGDVIMDTCDNRPYKIACEHEHSCCVLIALRRFFVNGVWHTWIDYDKFMFLVRSGRTDFTAAEYAAATPSWAVFRSNEKGFDPTQQRVRRKDGTFAVKTSGC